MEIKLVLLQIILIMELVSSFTIKYHIKKRYCGNQLSDKLQELGCVYNRPPEQYIYSQTTGIGIVDDCCHNNCTEYELVTMYCETSDIHHLSREMPISERSNTIQQDFYEQNEQNVKKTHFLTNEIKKESQETQIKNRELLDKFWPWERQIKTRGLGNLRMNEIFPNDELQKSKRLTGLLNLGKPGCGAPHRIRTIEDPVLRFQWSKDLKRTVDNNIRYKKERTEQLEYKKQLDKLVHERRKLKEKEKRDSLKEDRDLLAKTPPWGKPGPGGILWRQPKDIGLNFLKSMGWSDEATLEMIENDYKGYKDKVRTNIDSYNRLQDGQRHAKGNLKNTVVNIKPYRLNPLSIDKANGDLVNIIAKKRYHPVVPLTTTDITKSNLTYFMDIREQNKIHLQELTKQMKRKIDNAKQLKEDDFRISKRHFETWNSFWGRPGHGAPLPETKKGHIEKMLFPSMMPVAVDPNVFNCDANRVRDARQSQPTSIQHQFPNELRVV